VSSADYSPAITLTTDFGYDSPYVAAMKGVLLTLNPRATLIDLSHAIPPQDLEHAAFFLAGVIPHFPAQIIHVIVVDPGVGTARAILYVELAQHRLLVPDNGCWTELLRLVGGTPRVIQLAESGYWRNPVSATFHGRDIFAPVAGHLSLGLDPALLGPAVRNWVALDIPPAKQTEAGWQGEVVFVDHFGNLITNIPGDALWTQAAQVQVGDSAVSQRVRTYGEAQPGSLVSLISSSGRLEIAVAQGNAAQQLGAGKGTPVSVLQASARK
jgi:S-adenosylmethionine hydrolase